MDRSEKQKLIATLHETLKKAELVVVTQQSGLTVAEVTNLRRQMRQAGAGYRVAKNRLARRALEGTKFEGLSPLLKGPTALAYSADPIAAAKVAVTYANSNNKLTIVGGVMAGQVLDSAAGSRRWPPCRPSTSCAARSWACWWLRRRRSPGFCRLRPVSWLGCSRLLPTRALRREPLPKQQKFKPRRNDKWLIYRSWLMSCRS